MHYLQEDKSKTSANRCQVGKSTIGQKMSLTCFVLVFIIMLSYIIYMPANAASNGYVSINAGSYGMDCELQTLINQCREKKATAHQMAECARNLGYAEDHVIIKTAQQVWAEQDKLQAEYSAELKAYNEKLSKWRTECPYATEIYEKLRARGLSHITASAIMGNIMAEVGGQTLENINPYLRAGNYYGMCMWNIYYCPKVDSRSIDGQVDYLIETMPTLMCQFGGSGSYEYFLSITDVGQAARYFCTYYERGSGHSTRAKNAVKALEYYR